MNCYKETNKNNDSYESYNYELSNTYPKKIGELKKGGYVCINNRPCKIIEYSSMKNGKHGHCKVTIVAIDLFSKKKIEYSQPASSNIDIPTVLRSEYFLLSVNEEEYCELKNLKSGEIRCDIKLPKDTLEDQSCSKAIKNSVAEGKPIMVVLISAMNISKIVDYVNCK